MDRIRVQREISREEAVLWGSRCAGNRGATPSGTLWGAAARLDINSSGRFPWLGALLLPLLASCTLLPTEVEIGSKMRLEFQLSTEQAGAGELVPFALFVVTEDQTHLTVDATITSDREGPLAQVEDGLLVTMAGHHRITARVSGRDRNLESTTRLWIDPASPHSLDLVLEHGEFTAGEGITYEVRANDRYGNRLNTDRVAVSADSSQLLVGGESLESTRAGEYTLTATFGTLSDLEGLEVLPAEAATMHLSLEDVDLEVYESTRASVDTWDIYGNDRQDSFTLTVEGAGSSAVVGNLVTFHDEGEYTLWAWVDASDLRDSVGPIRIDSTGPELVVEVPARGSWGAEGPVEVSGTVQDALSDVALVEVDGLEAWLEEDGRFWVETPGDFGVNALETTATDSDGNASDDIRASLIGGFLSYGGGLESGMVVRLNEGSGGLGELAILGEDLVTDADIDSVIDNPVFHQEVETCWPLCITWYGLEAEVYNPGFSSVDLVLDTLSTGQIRGRVTLYDPMVDWHGEGVLAGVGYSQTGSIVADSVTVTATLTPEVVSGGVYATLEEVSVTSQGFDFEAEGWVYEVFEYLAGEFDPFMQEKVERAIADAVEAALPELVAGLLQELEVDNDLSLGGNSYSLYALPSEIDVDNAGLTLGLKTWFFPTATWGSAYSGPGSLHADYPPPSGYPSSDGMTVAAGLDFLNQVLFGFWGGGFFDREYTADQLGVEPIAVLPDLHLGIELLLPPVLLPGASDATLELQLGDVRVLAYNGPSENNALVAEFYVAATASLGVEEGDYALLPAVDEVELRFDVVQAPVGFLSESETEALLEALVPGLVPELLDSLEQIHLPEIYGFELENLSVDSAGANNGFVQIGGFLTAQ